jgi:hypothetical protein
MNTQQEKLLERFRSGMHSLDRFAGPAASSALLDFRPELPDAWTVREHIVHFVDAEVHFYIRIRAAIAEPGALVSVFAEEKWTVRLAYGAQPLEEIVGMYASLRSVLARLLASCTESWEKCFIQHPVRGQVGLEKLLDIACGHLDAHLEYIKRNEGLFAKKR